MQSTNNFLLAESRWDEMTLELSNGQADLLYNTLMALCLQYEEVIEKADTASKKKTYQNYREKTLEIIRQIEKQRTD